jgi:glycosyltransferase involved in cell wall biosynthesis
MPRVSVLIPLYDGEAFIAECLRSVQRQTFTDWEAIVVDDGSRDGGAQVVERAAAGDARIRLLRQANAHTQAARNTALSAAHGEWVALLDQDDVWLPEKLALQMELAARAPEANLLFTESRHWDGERLHRFRYGPGATLPRGDCRRALVFTCLFTASSVLVRTADVRAAGGFDPAFPRFGDHDLWLRLAERSLSVAGRPEVLVYYRVWGGNVSSDLAAMAEEGIRLHESALGRAQTAVFARLHRRALVRARAHRAMTSVLAGVQRSDELSAPAMLRIWSEDKRQVKWLARGALLGWPRALGGGLVQAATRRRLLAKARAVRGELG